ncbi:MAG: DUF5105 domain-containing protein [Clostridiales bacterium]|nr:DUF5105 domain-containing protein [Clostridiales bacterium]
MKTRAKQFLALCFAVVLSVSLLVGCAGGGDTSTPDGMLNTSLSAVKNGDLKAMAQISGEDISSSDFNDMDMGQMEKMMKALFSNVNVNATLKESNDKTATVSVKGTTGDLSSLSKEMSTELQTAVTEWATKNVDKLMNMTEEQMAKETLNVMIPILEKHVKNVTSKDVDVEIKMEKDDNGKWNVADESAADMAFILFGNSSVNDFNDILGM